MSTLKTKLILLKELLALKEVVDKGSIQIAANAGNLIRSSKTDQKRALLKLILSNFAGDGFGKNEIFASLRSSTYGLTAILPSGSRL